MPAPSPAPAAPQQPERPTRPVLEADPAEVQRLTQYLAGQPHLKFTEALMDCLMDPVPAEVLAFRSDALAEKTLAACVQLLDQLNQQIASNGKGMRRFEGLRGAALAAEQRAWRQDVFRIREAVGIERRLVQDIVRGMRARNGQLGFAPNPRGRAMRELVRLNVSGGDNRVPVRVLTACTIDGEQRKQGDRIRVTADAAGEAIRAGLAWPVAGDTPKGIFNDLLGVEQEKDAEAKRKAKAEAKAAAKEREAQERAARRAERDIPGNAG